MLFSGQLFYQWMYSYVDIMVKNVQYSVNFPLRTSSEMEEFDWLMFMCACADCFMHVQMAGCAEF